MFEDGLETMCNLCGGTKKVNSNGEIVDCLCVKELRAELEGEQLAD